MFTRHEITEKVYTTIREVLYIEDLEINLDSKLDEDLSIDSIDGITLIMDLEEICDIEIDDKELQNFITVESIVNYIENNLPEEKK